MLVYSTRIPLTEFKNCWDVSYWLSANMAKLILLMESQLVAQIRYLIKWPPIVLYIFCCVLGPGYCDANPGVWISCHHGGAWPDNHTLGLHCLPDYQVHSPVNTGNTIAAGMVIATLSYILDYQLSWESCKFQLARWSHRVALLSDRIIWHLPLHILLTFFFEFCPHPSLNI